MADLNPSEFFLLAPAEDETGSSGIAVGKVIGGGGDQDEARVLAAQSIYLWTQGVRGTESALMTYGEASAPAPIYETTVASGSAYEEIAQIPLYLHRGRTAIGVDVVATDLDISLRLYRSDGSTAIGSASTYTAAGRWEEQIAGLDATNAYQDCVLKVSIKKDAGAGGNGKLWALRIVADAAPLTTDATADFKKLDDAILAANQPFDAFLLQRVMGNLEAAYNYRLPRGGTWWPDQVSTSGVASRPLLWGRARSLALLLPPIFAPEGASELEVVLRGTVASASVSLALHIWDAFEGGDTTGIGLDDGEVAGVSATPTSITLTRDLAPYQGRFVVPYVVVFSAFVGGIPPKQSFSSGTTNAGSPAKISDLASLTFTASKRYALYWEDAGTQPESPYPADRDVIFVDGDDAYVWPLLRDGEWGAGANYLDQAYDIYAEEVGVLTLYGVRWRVSAVEARASLAQQLRPALPVAAPSIRALYRRARDLWVGRPPCLAWGGGYDPVRTGAGSAVRNLLGQDELFQDLSWADMGSGLVGRYDASSLDEGVTPSVRSRIRIVGVAALSGAVQEGYGVELEIRATLATWGGSAWDADVVEGEEEAFAGILLGGARTTAFLSAQLLGWRAQAAGASPSYHYLRGLIHPPDLERGICVPFSVEVTDTETTAERRLLRLQTRSPRFRAADGQTLGRDRTETLAVHILSWAAFAWGT